jgi:hypothetical protein
MLEKYDVVSEQRLVRQSLDGVKRNVHKWLSTADQDSPSRHCHSEPDCWYTKHQTDCDSQAIHLTPPVLAVYDNFAILLTVYHNAEIKS